MSAKPKFAPNAMEFLFRLLVMLFLVETGMDHLLSIDLLASSFTCPKTITRWIEEHAVDCSLQTNNVIPRKQVYTACDKGNKKSVVTLLKCWPGTTANYLKYTPSCLALMPVMRPGKIALGPSSIVQEKDSAGAIQHSMRNSQPS